MTATPADVALYMNDGRLFASPDKATSDALKAAHIDAQNGGDTEIEMFWDSADHGQILLDERFDYLGQIDPAHEGIEVEESLLLGTDVPIAPTVPCFTIVDDSRGLNVLCRTRAYAADLTSDRCSVEVLE
jgi:hypothetical protein